MSTEPEQRARITLAVAAMGGQGGGVLADWIVAIAEQSAYYIQTTSVPGVAQRTGATIYYLELFPETPDAGSPVLGLMPIPGDVDIVVAAELAEAGRAVQRGIVTPDRTTLIASTHRAYAYAEKSAMGDGRISAAAAAAPIRDAAKTLISFDMQALAEAHGTVISATLFGALAGSGALPFPRAAFEEAIRAGGKGVVASLRGFAAGFEAAQGEGAALEAPAVAADSAQVSGPPAMMKDWQALMARIAAMPGPVQDMAKAGLAKVVDFLDCAYGGEYLDHLEGVLARDTAAHDWALSAAAAKYIANAMAYDDIIRVADLKTRSTRFHRITGEMKVEEGQLVELTEFFHPRAEEIASLMPAKMGAKWEANPRRMAMLARWFNKGRRLRTHRLRSFVMLHLLGGLKGYRRRTRRHEVEQAHLKAWLRQSLAPLERDYALSVELLKCRRLIKGYSDTHVRGLSKFATVMEAAKLLDGREDAAEWVARLREAALQDPDGKALAGAVQTIRSFI